MLAAGEPVENVRDEFLGLLAHGDFFSFLLGYEVQLV
jgi:hypothetical protein